MLVGERVTIGAIIPEDKQELFAWINDPELVRFNAPFRPVDWQSHCEWFENLGKDPSRIIFAIRKRDGDKLIGTIQLHSIHPIHRSAELSIRIGQKSEQGRGLGTESLGLALQYAWDKLHLSRINLHVFADNKRAIAAYKKTGFVEEGLRKRAALIDGEWHDVVLMGVLNEKFDDKSI